jgi:hypothetical protein
LPSKNACSGGGAIRIFRRAGFVAVLAEPGWPSRGHTGSHGRACVRGCIRVGVHAGGRGRTRAYNGPTADHAALAHSLAPAFAGMRVLCAHGKLRRGWHAHSHTARQRRPVSAAHSAHSACWCPIPQIGEAHRAHGQAKRRPSRR